MTVTGMFAKTKKEGEYTPLRTGTMRVCSERIIITVAKERALFSPTKTGKVIKFSLKSPGRSSISLTSSLIKVKKKAKRMTG